MKQKKLFISVALCLLIVGQHAMAATRVGSPTPATKGKMNGLLNANAWRIITTNYGEFVFPASGNSGGTWNGAGYSYIYGGGLWFGARDSAGTPQVSFGYNPNDGASLLGPCNPFPPYDYSNFATDPQAKLFLSSNPADLAVWPLKDASGNNIVKSVQDGFCAYSDQNPAFMISGNVPIGFVVKQTSYAWNYADNNDVVFFYFKIYNNSGHVINNCYVGPCFDCDVGYESGTLANDRTDFDYTRALAIQYQTSPEPGYPRIGVVGARYFESPINNTGATVHVTDVAPSPKPTYSHDILPGQALGLTAFKVITIDIDPSNAVERYKNLQGITHTTDFIDAYDEWGSDMPGDKRFLMSSGPFNMPAGDSVTTCVGVMAAWDRTSLYTSSDVAQEIYNNHFQLAMPPTVPTLTAFPLDRAVRLVWNKAAETAPDPYYSIIDSTKRWYTYFPRTWHYCPDTLLVDSLRIMTSSTTSVAISRSAPNPVGGTDTLEAYYNQRALYSQYDLQGYALYRAASLADLDDPAKRTQLGPLHSGSSGARSRSWDKRDGYQIVLDIVKRYYTTPSGIETLAVYDTLGTDCGLSYMYVDSNAVNGIGYYYGLSAFDYQPNVYFTRKCPTTLASLASANSVLAAPRADTSGTLPPGVFIRVDGISDARYGGALNYFQNLAIADPAHLFTDSFKVRWNGPFRTVAASGERVPWYKGSLYNAAGGLVDTLVFMPKCDTILDANGWYTRGRRYNGTPNDQLPFGGIVFYPFLNWTISSCKADSLQIIEAVGGQRTYPKDSTSTFVDTLNVFLGSVSAWQWQGADYEIRWKDSIGVVGTNPNGNILTCTVWDITHNRQVPWDGTANKANMTQAGWAFDPRATSYARPCLDSLTAGAANQAGWGMYISGVNVYFRNRVRRILWSQRPETGDVWRVFCSGPGTPVTDEVATFTTVPTIGSYPAVVAPNGGERWASGYPHTIRWRRTGANFAWYRLRLNDGYPIADTVNLLDTSYVWNIPAWGTLTGRKVIVEMMDGAGTIVASDQSDGTFDIVHPDPVWPGDCTNNGMVTAYDVLQIGRYWGQTGPARDSVSMAWEAKSVVPWSPDAGATFADCDGDGTVNIQDVLAIGSNWHLTHTFKSSPPEEDLDDPDLVRYVENYRAILRGLSGESDAVKEIRQLLESVIGKFAGKPFPNYLSAARPNPAAHGCAIEFGVAQAGPVSLRIYNIAGQLVATMVDRQLRPGHYSFRWDGTNKYGRTVGAGVYIYRLRTAAYCSTKKLTVIR